MKSLRRTRERKREMENNFEMGLTERGFQMEDGWYWFIFYIMALL
jgi:hypothetical protein